MLIYQRWFFEYLKQNQNTIDQPTQFSLLDFFLQLQKQDIKLDFDDDRLRCDAPKVEITKELRLQIKNHKGKIVEFLQHKKKNFLTLADLKAEAILDGGITPESHYDPNTKVDNILLTGGTGFLGQVLLQ